MNIEDQKSLIGNVIAFTLTIIALIFIVFCAVLSAFFPKLYGDVLFSIGLRNLSLSAYEFNYKQTQDINDLYLLVGKSILAKNDEFIIKSYEMLERQDDYYHFIAYLENQHMNNSISTLEMLYVSNEDNYLKGKYTVALKNFKSSKDGFEYAYNDLQNASITSSKNRINYVLGYYINSLESEQDYVYITAEVKDDIYAYFEDLYSIYESEINELTLPDNEYYLVNKFNLLKLNYRLSDIYYSMKQIDSAVSFGIDLSDADLKLTKLKEDFPKLL